MKAVRKMNVFRQTFENLNNLTNENIDIELNAQNQMIGKPNNFLD